MDEQRFDAWTRTLRSRRTALGGLLGGGLAALLGLGTELEAGAKRKRRRRKKRKRCRRDQKQCGRRCIARSACCPACPPGRKCIGNATCAQDCGAAPTGCPAGCLCHFPLPGLGRLCIRQVSSCDELPGTCSGQTAGIGDCPPGHICQGQNCDGVLSNRCVPLC